MGSRIRAELRGGVKIGSIPVFRTPDGLTRETISANLNGLEVGLRWHYDDITAVIFTEQLLAESWPGFELDQ